MLDTLEISQAATSLNLLHEKTQVLLKLEICGLEDNTVRFRITELETRRPRFEASDVLVGSPRTYRLSVEKQTTEELMLLGRDSLRISVSAHPFRIDVLSGGELVTSVNARGLLLFEHSRTRGNTGKEETASEEKTQDESPEGEEKAHEEEPDLGTDEKENQEEMTEEEEEGTWEESFKSHHDSKPYGPMSVGLDFSLPGFEDVYGIPEHADSFRLRTTSSGDPYRLYNLDVFQYELENPMALYGSVPYLVAHSPERTLGLFWLNPTETWIDIASNTAGKTVFGKMLDFVRSANEGPQMDVRWMSESGIVDAFLLLGPLPTDVFRQYAALAGTQALPPLFALAYHQSRWNYNDEDDVLAVDAGFDKHNLPMDVIWLDIEHTDGKRYFTWDSNKFPNPADMQNHIAGKRRKMVTIVDPHLKVDSSYSVYNEAYSRGYLVKNKGGGDYEGWCWPGSAAYLDFLNPEVRDWYASKFAYDSYLGSTDILFTWNDMNEPSVFNGPEVTLHKDALHHGGWEHRDVHNLYGFYQQWGTVGGQLRRSGGNERPFVLARAFFAGSQRFGAVWTGDNLGEWSHLKASISMVLSLNLCGLSFSGADIGGFFKNPSTELLVRWYQAGAYQPLFRAHAHIDTARREPWIFGSDTTALVRTALRERYALLPYWYTVFYWAYRSGMPVMRALWIEFPKEEQTFMIEDEYMIGNALLVHPVTEAASRGVNVYLPGAHEVWYDVHTQKKYSGGQEIYYPVKLSTIPVFQRGGTIIPRKDRPRRSSACMSADPYTLYIALDDQKSAEGELYMDDEHSFNFEKQNEYQLRHFLFKGGTLKASVSSHIPPGKYSSTEWLERIVIVGIAQPMMSVLLKQPGSQDAPLAYEYTPELSSLIVRRPGVRLTAEWTIVIR
uniref:Neutral alpha-glucosidase AB n=1 Tax=Eptatretus burgeri TaxID=7764 RepID=A0A8C4WV05_EPTBU